MDDLITIGKIGRPFGVQGEVRVQSLTDVPGRLENLDQVTLVTGSGQSVVTSVRQVREDGKGFLFKFSAFHTPEEAKSFSGAWVKIPPTPVPPLPPGEFYQFELIGLSVEDVSGKSLGILEEVMDIPSHHVFVVRSPDEEWLIPATRKIVLEVDVLNKRMIVAALDEWMPEDAM
ncbi:MAG: ribosome maturation factor RimM [Nitrospirae bacterium]|nr:ribosome maturation factor RimM [Nitrospirota bacterium]